MIYLTCFHIGRVTDRAVLRTAHLCMILIIELHGTSATENPHLVHLKAKTLINDCAMVRSSLDPFIKNRNVPDTLLIMFIVKVYV